MEMEEERRWREDWRVETLDWRGEAIVALSIQPLTAVKCLLGTWSTKVFWTVVYPCVVDQGWGGALPQHSVKAASPLAKPAPYPCVTRTSPSLLHRVPRQHHQTLNPNPHLYPEPDPHPSTTHNPQNVAPRQEVPRPSRYVSPSQPSILRSGPALVRAQHRPPRLLTPTPKTARPMAPFFIAGNVSLLLPFASSGLPLPILYIQAFSCAMRKEGRTGERDARRRATCPLERRERRERERKPERRKAQSWLTCAFIGRGEIQAASSSTASMRLRTS